MNAKLQELCETLNATCERVEYDDLLDLYHNIAQSVYLTREGWVPYRIRVEGVRATVVSFLSTVIFLDNGMKLLTSKYGMMAYLSQDRVIKLDGHTAIVVSEGKKADIVFFTSDDPALDQVP